jgi:hypothetical protein
MHISTVSNGKLLVTEGRSREVACNAPKLDISVSSTVDFKLSRLSKIWQVSERRVANSYREMKDDKN